MAFDHDVAIIGSGFGGSVSALRLTEKGYRVAVIEAGRRYTRDTMPKSDFDMRNYLWFPRLGMRGMMRMTLLKDVFILSGSAVGGGSIVYANTLYQPLEAYWDDPQWAGISDWRDEFAPFYDQAERMLGVNPVPNTTNADRLMQKIATRMGVEDTFHPTNVGVWFGTPGERVADPYFGGEGPDRVGCIHCGGCMVGCQHEAKNSLDHNYLYLAEKHGATVIAERQVTDLEPLPRGGFRLTMQRPGAIVNRQRASFTAEQVVFAAGALGTAKLLHRLRDEGRLPNVSPKLGSLTRTNSEAIVGASSRNLDTDWSQGVAITSSIHPNENTHIEPVRYPKGSGATVAMTSAMMVDGGGGIPRWLRFLLTALRHPILFLRSMFTYRRVAERSIILLVMQSLDNSLQVFRRRTPFGSWLTSKQGHGKPNPTWLPEANEAARIAAEEMDGIAVGSIFEAIFDIPTTAHIMGGCPIGESPETGVIDPWHRLYGHEGLHVCDGSAITANLGVNPSLTITAMTERAMSFWPNKGQQDPRPALGQPYERLSPVAPLSPAVPADAPAALQLPIVA